MSDSDETKDQLLEELNQAHQQITSQKAADAEGRRVDMVLNESLQEAHRRRQETEALLDSSRAILAYHKFEDSARAIFDSAKVLTGATSGYVALLSDDGVENEVLFLDSGGLPCTVDPTLPMPIRGLRSEAYHLLQTVYDNEFTDSQWMKYMPTGHVALDNVLFAPLILEGKAVGLLGLANKLGGFTEDDARMATAFGELAAIALFNSRTLENLEKTERELRQLNVELEQRVAERTVELTGVNARLQASETRMRAIFENSLDAIGVSKAGVHVTANPAYLAMFGYESADQLQDKPILNLIAASEHTRIISYMRQRMQGQVVPSAYETRGCRRDGTEFDMEVRVSTYELDGEIYSVVILRDITERKQSEAKLRRSVEEYKVITSTTLDGFWVVGLDGRLLDVNDAYCQMTGYDRATLLTMFITDLESQESLEETKAHIQKLIKIGYDRFESRHRCQDGRIVDVEVSSTFVSDFDCFLSFIRDITENKRSALALYESEVRYRQMFMDNQAVKLLIHPETGAILEANPAAVEFYGYPAEVLLSMHITDINTLSEDEVRREMRRATTEERRFFRFQHKLASSEIRDVEVYTGPVDIQSEKLLFSIIIDVTERKKAENALRQERNLLQQIAQTSPVGISVVDRQGQITFANTSAEQILGLSKDEITARTYNDPTWRITDLAGNPFPDERLPFSQVMTSGQSVYDVQHAIERPDGRKLFLSINAAPLVDNSDEIEGMVTAIEDITKRKEAEDALRVSEERYRGLIEGLDETVFRVVLPEAKYEYVSPSALTVFGYSADEFMHTPQMIAKIIHPDFVDYYRQGWPDLLKGNVPRTYEYKIVDPDGNERWIYQSNRGIFDEKGNIIALESLCRNVTLQKQASEYLERVVEERTAELKAANDQLQKLSRAKDEFVSNVSHELRTPVTSLILRQYVLRQQPEHLDYHLDVLERETERLNHIIESLLQLSRIDQNRIEFKLLSTDLNELASKLVEDRVPAAGQKGLALSFEKDTKLPRLIANPELLEQVLSILLTNAINYTPPGGQIAIKTCKKLENGRLWAGFSVKDTGPGIAPSEQKHLFERFFRGTVGRNSRAPGTGLGLAIAKEIMDMHQGNIVVKSSGIAGQGTTFQIWLPIHED